MVCLLTMQEEVEKYIEKEIKEIPARIKSYLIKIFAFVLKGFPKGFIKNTIYIGLSLLFAFAYLVWPLIINTVDNVLPAKTQATPQSFPTEKVEIDLLEKNSIENRCNGYQFNIVGNRYIKPVGSQRFFAEELGYSARNTEYFQAASETLWGCRLPFTVQIISVPIEGTSFGLFVEYKDMFKILIGDGDRKTIRVEEKKYNSTGSKWVDITAKNRQFLVNPIENSEEVTLDIQAKVEREILYLHISIYHSKFQDSEHFDFELIPNSVNFKTEQPRVFRIGINDFMHKGNGSVIDLKTVSIKEGQW